MGAVPTEEPAAGAKVKSIFCFAIAPKMKRQGIARQLLERVCQDAAQDGFDVVEAYPNKQFIDEPRIHGACRTVPESGFFVHYETEQKLVGEKKANLSQFLGMAQGQELVSIRRTWNK
jgi:GNAT superfamily N-acetyltransferase